MRKYSCMTFIAGLLALLPVLAEDVVIMRDGYTIRGKTFKEKNDQDINLKSLKFSTTNLDVIDCGPRFLFFSSHNKKGAIVEKDLNPEQVTKITRNMPVGLGRPLPPLGEITPTEFDNHWQRKLINKVAGQAPDTITQYVAYIDPKTIHLLSNSHRWRTSAYLEDFGPETIRKLVSTHPDYRDSLFGFVDPERRIRIARFLKDAGWFRHARSEMEQLKKIAPWQWPKKAEDLYDTVTTEIDTAEALWVTRELELAINSGRYNLARRTIDEYQPKSNDPKVLDKLTVLKAHIETVQPQYNDARQFLEDSIDRLTQAHFGKAWASVLGGFAVAITPTRELKPDEKILLNAARVIQSELHPDSASRLARFIRLAKQANPTAPDKLLAMAVTGWCNGDGGAVPEPAIAIKTWKTREFLISYLSEPLEPGRARLLKQYQASNDKLSVPDIALMIPQLPPVQAESLESLQSKLVAKSETIVPNVYRFTLPKVRQNEDAMQYLVRLPAEYHHGRSYPVIIGINHSYIPAEKAFAMYASEFDRRGFILAVPVWGNQFISQRFDLSGKDHPMILSMIRDLSMKFQIDPDRVTAFGFGDGANFALDLAMSKPDQFASVVSMGPVPDERFYLEYWRNAQKMPVYTVTGELSGLSWQNVRSIYERWLPLGYPMLLSVYKGRSVEWYTSELPNIFDWIELKKRVRGTASLRLDSFRFDPWQSMRESDSRFYWLSGSDHKPGNLMTPPNRSSQVPATFRGDIRRGNDIFIDQVRGFRKITVWLERDMIDWTAPVKVTIDGQFAGMKPKVLEPDLGVLLEELYRTGDRKMLFFGKLEFKVAG